MQEEFKLSEVEREEGAVQPTNRDGYERLKRKIDFVGIIDIISKIGTLIASIVVPVLLYSWGQQFNSQQQVEGEKRYQQTQIENDRKDRLDKELSRKRWVLERYTAMIPFLSSGNPRERAIAVGFLSTIHAQDSDKIPIYQTLLTFASDPDSSVASKARQAIRGEIPLSIRTTWVPETPTPAPDGKTATFYVKHSIQLDANGQPGVNQYWNGILLKLGVDYTVNVAEQSITFGTPGGQVAPQAGDYLQTYYLTVVQNY